MAGYLMLRWPAEGSGRLWAAVMTVAVYLIVRRIVSKVAYHFLPDAGGPARESP